MKKTRKYYKSKIGYCNNSILGINKPKGHYVYIRKIHNNGTCDVNVITSLEDKNSKMNFSRLKQVKKGNVYAIPKYDTNFGRWSGVTKKPIKNIRLKDIANIGTKKIKKRHHFFIGKFMK